jgi:HEAT repeat protein
MKSFAVLSVLGCTLLFASVAKAGDDVLPPGANRALIEQNLFIGLQSSNAGLQRSCAAMLGKIHAQTAVIPLLAALKQGDNDRLKIAAAWALCQIGDARGTFAVKRSVVFDDSPDVQSACAMLYNAYVKADTFGFNEIAIPALLSQFVPDLADDEPNATR